NRRPYNDQVNRFKERLIGREVGTVDSAPIRTWLWLILRRFCGTGIWRKTLRRKRLSRRIGICGRCASLPRLARVVRVRASFCPENELGEASVEMNRILNGLAPGTIPRNGMDAVQFHPLPAI